MSGVEITCILIFLTVWVLGLAWESGYLKFLGKKLELNRHGIALRSVESKADRLGFERRSLIEKGRQFRARALLLGGIWVLLMAALFILARPIGAVAFVLMGLVSIGFVIVHFRSDVKHLMKLILTTSCSQCGRCPMEYVAHSSDDRRLLVCKQCRIEWDLGPDN